jgi:hypothetical protein
MSPRADEVCRRDAGQRWPAHGGDFRVLATERVSGKGRSCCNTRSAVDAVDLSRTRSVGLCVQVERSAARFSRVDLVKFFRLFTYYKSWTALRKVEA